MLGHQYIHLNQTLSFSSKIEDRRMIVSLIYMWKVELDRSQQAWRGQTTNRGNHLILQELIKYKDLSH